MVLSTNLVVIGAGGFAREVAAMIQQSSNLHVVGYVVEEKFYRPGLLGTVEWLKGREDVSALCCVADTSARERLAKQAESWDIEFYSFVHPGVGKLRVGAGTVVMRGCDISASARIGVHVHLNLGCIVGNDVTIEDYVTVCPGAIISGNVLLRAGCFIGAGAVVLPGRRVGYSATVGAGAVCIRDVPNRKSVVGVPARVVD
jgi:sugar O-acyltransferase (sialic acid O-acetyltransferase NeuD family)